MKEFADIYNNENIQRFLTCCKSKKSFTTTGLNSFYKMLLISLISDEKILFITDKEQKALKYQNDLNKFFNIKSKIFPYQEASLFDEIKTNVYRYKDQINSFLNTENNNVLIATVKSLSEKFPTQKFIEENSIAIKINEDININDLVLKLTDLGYVKATVVTDIGEFSKRGDIIDIYSLDDKPYRIELWGDTVTDIRIFDNETQKSLQKINEVKIKPIYKFVLTESKKQEFKTKYKNEELIEKIENEKYFEGIEYFQNFFNKDLRNLIDLIPENYTIILDESSDIFAKATLIEETNEKKYKEAIEILHNEILEEMPYSSVTDIRKALQGRQKIFFDNFINADNDFMIEMESSSPPIFSSSVQEIGKYINIQLENKFKVVIATNYPKRVIEILKENEIIYSENGTSDQVSIKEDISLGGSVLEDLKILVLTDKELFNKKNKSISNKKYNYFKENQEYINSINDIQTGDFVVHKIHGIGLYKGLTQQEIDGEYKDYLTIEYAKGDKLHIPAEQINFLFRYRGTSNIQPKLSKMGGNDWEIIKSRVKKAVEDVAKDLINLYARRKISKGIKFDEDTTWQYEMEDAFEYTETPDQLTAINEIKADMETEKPMDRLVCGDVGFGKTEVAMRAIFKAIMSGKQAAVVVPTTILAYQHYQTIKERFSPYPVEIELLSRFKTQKEQKDIVKKLKNNQCNLVIGTHRLLQKDIAFKDLGLLVIDEEHRFGVADKEKLKHLKKDIDIISMSATPIPRTLYMSLSGIKDMSVINTPPTNRLPIKTLVCEFNEDMVKKAVNYELDREGQIFILYNRVESIYEFADIIKSIVPNARITVAHGKLDQKSLEEIMVNFQEHLADILICTTIIESGLDIPNANTIMIYNADKLGLAQLYQLRGRVGRSERQAYCYCFYQKNKILTEDATSRLTAIKDFTNLGSGYQIALRDIEIRGVGNILGTKQHGNMVNVGFDTYCDLLDEAIKHIQGEETEQKVQSIIDINVTAFISDDWVGSKEQKMIEYKRLADVTTINEAEEITAEWKDRFAKFPEEVENLIKLVKLRILASDAKISLVRQTSDNVRIYTPYNQAEWAYIVKKSDSNITKYIKYTKAPTSCKDGNSIILLNNKYLSFEKTFNLLSELFYGIVKITNEFKAQ